MNNIVLCYFKDLNNQFAYESKELISLWARSWTEHGWNPVILSEKEAKQNINYDIKLWHNDSNLIKNSNPSNPLYIQVCYERWFAYDNFIQQHGVVHWADYDVINYSYFYDQNTIKQSYKLDPSHCCGILGPEHSNRIMNLIAKYAYCDTSEFENLELRDNNDMALLDKCRVLPLQHVCANPLSDRIDYRTASLVHFHGGLRNQIIDNINLRNKTRLQIIESLRKYE